MEYRKSKLRDEILKLLQETDIHPTAGWLYDQLKVDNPNLSQGTIYRNLGILVEQGLVDKIDFGSTFDRFEYKKPDHYHFICEKCGAIIDLDIPIKTELNSEVEKIAGFKTRKHQIEFYGICDACK
ncbi:MAG: transcriptional repressor [Spirochaetales bacterium]|uniref:Transcriptional repressor n=1 Tax=Candidatus Thalassospirochaeta sargassi TaxID=3119039 RepID=A0AAJ1ICY0_9SPIO|nr:transcriptional repressor [Spirochaetales bacterium]